MDNNKLDIITNLFEEKEIRSIWNSEKEEYFFSVVDVVSALTNSNDPAHYWRTLKSRMLQEGNETVTNCDTFKFKAKDEILKMTDIKITTRELTICRRDRPAGHFHRLAHEIALCPHPAAHPTGTAGRRRLPPGHRRRNGGKRGADSVRRKWSGHGGHLRRLFHRPEAGRGGSAGRL